jgi:hypothetical protein
MAIISDRAAARHCGECCVSGAAVNQAIRRGGLPRSLKPRWGHSGQSQQHDQASEPVPAGTGLAASVVARAGAGRKARSGADPGRGGARGQVQNSARFSPLEGA